MKTLAIIAIVLICLLVLAFQHLLNWLIRTKNPDGSNMIFGILGIVVSVAILATTIYNAVLIFGCQQ